MFWPAAKLAQIFFKHINPNPKLCAAQFSNGFLLFLCPYFCAINTIRIQFTSLSLKMALKDKRKAAARARAGKSRSVASLMMTTAVAKQYSHDSLTSWLKNLLYKRLLKLLAISVFSCPNSTVNSILLSSSGVQSRNIFGIIVTIPLTRSRRTCRKRSHQ